MVTYFVPSENSRVLEVSNSKIGTFIDPTEKVTSFKKVRAGFIPALPKIPYNTLSGIIVFLVLRATENASGCVLFDDTKRIKQIISEIKSKIGGV